MIKEFLVNYARYSQWAHKRLLDLINTLSPEQQHTSIPSSFDTVYKTVFHVWGAESLWFSRLNRSAFSLSGDPFEGSMQKLSMSLESVDSQWLEWFKEKEEGELKENIHYLNLSGQPFEQPYDLLLMQVFNHNTYHNGQLVTMLRALGLDKIPSTDFIAWARLNA
jgi:uncharacterized damage-inducible protein DinB